MRSYCTSLDCPYHDECSKSVTRLRGQWGWAVMVDFSGFAGMKQYSQKLTTTLCSGFFGAKNVILLARAATAAYRRYKHGILV